MELSLLTWFLEAKFSTTLIYVQKVLVLFSSDTGYLRQAWQDSQAFLELSHCQRPSLNSCHQVLPPQTLGFLTTSLPHSLHGKCTKQTLTAHWHSQVPFSRGSCQLWQTWNPSSPSFYEHPLHSSNSPLTGYVLVMSLTFRVLNVLQKHCENSDLGAAGCASRT